MKLRLYAYITFLLSSHYITSSYSYYDDCDSDAETVVEQYQDNGELLLAVQENDYELLKSILSIVTPDIINKCDEDGFNALHYATYNGNDKIVCLLLEHGANPNICELNEGNSPLIIAVDLNHPQIN